MARLIIVSGPDRGRSFELGQTQTLGRLKRNEICLHDEGASREHARIARRGQSFLVLDLNSSNGITVNGERVQRRVLQHGDQLQVGNSCLSFEDAKAETPAQPASGKEGRQQPTGPPEASSDITFGAAAHSATSATRVLTATHKRKQASGRPSLLWLQGDFQQLGGGLRLLLSLGALVLLLALGYAAFRLTAG